MTDGRKACAELCQVSQLALFLAGRGRAAGLHQALKCLPAGVEHKPSQADGVREPTERSWGEGSGARGPRSDGEPAT